MSFTAAFLLIAVTVFAMMMGIVLWPLLRKSRASGESDHANEDAQKSSLQEAILGIDAEAARGEIDASTSDVRKREVLLRARAESIGSEATPRALINAGVNSPIRSALAVCMGLGIAVFASTFYLWLGNPNAMNPAAVTPTVAQNAQVGPAQVAEMVKRLEAKLSVGPPKLEDLTGWKMLARSQMVMQQYGKAVESYRIALRLVPNTPEVETSLAEALLAQAEGKPSEEAEKLLASAYVREPTNPKILWLSAAVAQERGDKPKAVKFLKEARATLAPDAPEINDIDRFISELSK